MARNATSAQVLYPALRYTDAHDAIRWLERAFGFEQKRSMKARTTRSHMPSRSSGAPGSCSAHATTVRIPPRRRGS